MSMLERAKIDLGVLALAAAGFSCRMQHTEQLIAGDNYNDLRIVSSLGPNHSVLPDPEIVTALEDIHERLREAILYRGILPRIPKDTLITDLVRNLDYAAHNTLSQNCTAIESESAPYLLEGLELFDRPLLNDLISNTQLHKSGLRYAPDPIFKEFSKAPSTILLDPTSSIQAQELTIIPLQVTFKLEGDELNVRLIDILKPSDPIYWSKQFSLQSSSTALCGELVRVAEEYYKKLWKAYPQGWLDDYEAVSSNGGIIYRQTTIAPALHLDRTKAPSSEDLRAWRDVLKECDIVLVFTIRGQLAAAQDKLAKYQCFRLKKSDLANLKNSSLRLDGDLVAILNVNRDSDLEITPKLLSSLSDSSYLGQDVITSFFLGPIFAERSDLTYGLSFNDMYEPIICSSVVEQGYLLSLSPYVSNSTVNGFTIYSSRSDQALVQPLYQKILEFTEGVNLAQKFFGVDPGVRIISLVEIESDNVLAKTVWPYAKQSYYQLPIDQLGARFGQWNYKAIGVHEYFHAFYMRQKLGHDSNLSQVFKRLEASSSSLLYSISEGRYVDRTGGHPQNGYQELGAAVLVAATLAERDSLITQLVRNVETRDLPDLLAVVAAIKLDLTLNNPNRLVVSEQAEIFKILQDYTEIIEQLILSGRTNSVTTLTVTKENENDYRTITIATIVAVASLLYASYRRSKSVPSREK